MTWFLAVLVMLAIGGVAVVFAHGGGSMTPADDERPALPERPLTGADLREVRFDTVTRGYRAAEVDALIERLAAELDDARRTDPGPR